jgi:hypothetical protein
LSIGDPQLMRRRVRRFASFLCRSNDLTKRLLFCILANCLLGLLKLSERCLSHSIFNALIHSDSVRKEENKIKTKINVNVFVLTKAQLKQD